MTDDEMVDRELLLICGSLRAASTNMAMMRTVLQMLPDGVAGTFYEGLATLPHFDPDDDHDPLPAAVEALRASLSDADAILFCTPEYAGGLPGSFKNLLDWTVGGQEIELPVGWINVSTAPGGAQRAHESLGVVLGYTGAQVVTTACRQIPVRRDLIDSDGTIGDETIRSEVSHVIAEILRHVPRQHRTVGDRGTGEGGEGRHARGSAG